jgi:hypothetical protein
MTIYRGPGGTGDTTTGEDVFGPNSSITDLSGLTGAVKTPTLIEFASGDLTPTERQLTWDSSTDKLGIGLASGAASVLTSTDIGVGVQAYSANLDEFATVNPTATGLALLDDATVADQRTTLGASTVGANLFTLTNPSAITFPRINADNTVNALSDSNFRTALGLGTLATQSGTFSGTSSGTNTGDQNLFGTVAVSGQPNVVADTTSDTLTLVAGTNISITTDATTDAITITASSTGIPDGDKGDITVSGTGSIWTIDNGAVSLAKTIGVAGSGANSDITSLTGLTTPLSVSQGGTGATTNAGTAYALKGANGDITSLTALTSQNTAIVTSASGGVGYGTGAGGTVTQATSKSTAVTLNKTTGRIAMNNAALAANTAVLFAFNNSLVGVNDLVIVSLNNDIGSQTNYRVNSYIAGAGIVGVILTNVTAGSLSDAVGINFVVIKGASA